MKRLALVLLAAACSSQSAAPKQTPPPIPEAKPAVVEVPANKGKVETRSFKSEALGVEKNYVVYLPASYDGTKRFPVFYYLHGLGGNERNCARMHPMANPAPRCARTWTPRAS
jgi:dipeptidyl aminopeptidase/acylaminoacyl peptidase